MKRQLICVIFILIAFNVFAQIQQGYVKTIGRPNAPGISLGGVTVRVTGNINTVISNPQGNFSFPITNQRFRFSRISKKGFELADKDFLHYDFGYTPDAPITLVMVSREELQKERDFIEEQSRNKLTLRFQEQYTALEKKLERNLLSEEGFRQQSLALQEKFDNIDTLVSTLAERYARTDYDNIDSTRILINQYIENGELERAQQLIYSKGNLDERTKELEETRKLRLQVEMRESKLQQDLAADLLQLSLIAQSQQKYDSVYIYLEKRYLTDTTQVKYLYDLASHYPRWSFLLNNRKERDNKHEAYLLKLYNQVQNSEIAAILNTNLYIIENELGYFYNTIEEYEKALFYYRKMLNTLKNEGIGFEYIPLRALGSVYFSQKKYTEALAVYQEALKYCKSEYIGVDIQIKIADIYNRKNDIDSALKNYIEAEKKYDILCDTVVWRINGLYTLQEFIATKYQEQGQNNDAIRFYIKAVNNAERCYNLTNRTKDITPIVSLLSNLQDLYASQGKYKQMYKYANKAISYARIYMERYPSSLSRLLYAEILCQAVNAKAHLGKTANIEQDLVECLKKSEFASNIFKERYKRLTGRIYHTFAINYFNQKLYNEALYSINKAVNILPTDIMYQSKIDILKAMGRKEEAIKTSKKMLEIKIGTLKP